jgi:Na+-translocating ferredoxin:NAD+ oxidoreductase subunit B
MNEQVYSDLRKLLDTLPNGYPSTDTGVEMKLLQKVFTEEEAGLFQKLRLNFESTEQISERTGIGLEYLKNKLPEMSDKGQLFGIHLGPVSMYKILPFVFGIYEFQLNRLDREFVDLFEEYTDVAFGKEFFGHAPALMKVVPVGVEVQGGSVIEPYESVAQLIETAKSWGVNDCICKKSKALEGRRCDKPMEVCLAFAPIEHAFDNAKGTRALTKAEAHGIMKMAEEAGLVHMTSNSKSGHFYICNCCKCCCHPLRQYNLNRKYAAAKSNYIAVVDKDVCTACGTCLDRCQVNAIKVDDFAIISDCIGCGLCSTTCPSGAIKIVRKAVNDLPSVPENELEWFRERAEARGIGSDYKKYL